MGGFKMPNNATAAKMAAGVNLSGGAVCSKCQEGGNGGQNRRGHHGPFHEGIVWDHVTQLAHLLLALLLNLQTHVSFIQW